VLNVLRLGFAGAAIVAMTYQFAATADSAFKKLNFFSFFTIQSNLLAVATLLLLVVVRRAERTRLFDTARSAVVLYMAVTGVVFALSSRVCRRSSRRPFRGSTSSCIS
jgi:predicted neutral ceramidase superfamily lipid hydrolase